MTKPTDSKKHGNGKSTIWKGEKEMKHLFDFDNGKILVNVDNQTAIDNKGNTFIRVSDDFAVNLETNDLHFTSGWDSDYLSNNDFD